MTAEESQAYQAMSSELTAGLDPNKVISLAGDFEKKYPNSPEKKLTEAETDANRALQLIEKLPKQGTETDGQLKKRKDSIASEPHGSLGMIHLQRASLTLTGGMDADELNKAAQEFKQSVDLTEHPAPQNYYRLGEVYANENKLDEAIAAFSKASEVGQGSGIQEYADKQIETLKKKQAQAKPAAH